MLEGAFEALSSPLDQLLKDESEAAEMNLPDVHTMTYIVVQLDPWPP